MEQSDLDILHMRSALALAALGQGRVEPNPMVGCLLVCGAETIGQGWHRQFGGPHAEIEALRLAADRARGATMYVTLEPCSHQGKTPPCTEAIMQAGISRVVAAQQDPFPQVAGRGVAELEASGIKVEVGLLEAEARRLNAPYLKLLRSGRPWIIAKWAMTLDGKIACRGGQSRWISGTKSRRVTHSLRGRVDAVMVGRQTAQQDDPLLTARPPGVRTALRVVVDSSASIRSESQLVRTARDVPLLVAVGRQASQADRERLCQAGCELLVCRGQSHADRLDELLVELGRRRLTNVLVEGGGRLLGSMFDAGQIDEVHAFIAPKLIGGAAATSPIAGEGLERMSLALSLEQPRFEQLGSDIYLHGQVAREQSRP